LPLPRLLISAAADADLTAIFRRSADRFGADVATDYLRALDALRRHSHLGALHPLTTEPVRSHRCRSHRIFYDADNAAITIMRVLHHAQSVEENL
jgi:plasmid stabilization system protein ParE